MKNMIPTNSGLSRNVVNGWKGRLSSDNLIVRGLLLVVFVVMLLAVELLDGCFSDVDSRVRSASVFLGGVLLFALPCSVRTFCENMSA